MSNRQYITAAILALACGTLFSAGLSAQDFNPTVEVSRQYSGNLMEVHKPAMDMALPDSVEKFNLAFDYSVFDNPYKGSYEFKPYLLNMNLEPEAFDGRRFYLRAGAGYTLHPELGLVWSPVSREKFRMSVYANHNSYVGKYRSIGMTSPASEGGRSRFSHDGGTYSGYELFSRAGVSGELDWKRGSFFFDAGYCGISNKDSLIRKGFDAFDMKLGLSSKFDTLGHFVYDIRAAYRYGEEKLKKGVSGNPCVTEHSLNLDARLGYSAGGRHSGLLDIEYDLARSGASFDSSAGIVSFAPRYVYDYKRWKVDFGVRLAFFMRSNGPGTADIMYQKKSQIVYPDVNVAFTIVKNHLDVYAKVGGGPELVSYSSLLSRNHHISPVHNPAGMPLLNFSEESVGAALGFKGSIASRFSFDLSAGYSNCNSLPMETIWAKGDGLYAPALGYTAAQLYWANLDYAVHTRSFELSGYFRLQDADLPSKYFRPSPFKGYIEATYNWNKRIFVGLDCDFALARRGGVISQGTEEVIPAIVPGFADLGVSFEFAFNRKFSLWLRGGNLLNMTIQRNVLYSESGISGTVGIALTL